jgi:hypothetical protein
MAKLFDGRTSVIFQDPKPIGFNVLHNLRKWVLLPQIAYKVLVPYPKDRELNVFQETILKLFQSGHKTSEYLAEKLLLDEELVRFVIGELCSLGLLTEMCALTPKGMEVLRNQYDQYEMKTGYVFYDVITGTFWDTFIFDEEFGTVLAHFGENSRTIEHGNVGNPRKEKAMIIKSTMEEYPEEPSNIDILKICIRHKRRMVELKRGGYVEKKGDLVQLPRNTEKVRYLGECKPFMAATMIFVPQNVNSGQAYWQVCHPFKGGISSKLRESLDKLKEESNHRYLKEEIRSLTEAAYGVTDTERELKENENEKKAGAYLTGIFGESIRKQAALYRQLVELYGLSLSLSGMSGNLGKNYDTVQTKMIAYIDAVYRLMGEVLYSLKNDYQDYFKLDYLQGDMQRNAEILGIKASRIGFRDTKDSAVFSRMLNVKKGAVQFADDGKDLKSMLAVNLLVADEIEDHPFWRLAKRVPQFIPFLDDLRSKRNSVDHSMDESYLYKAVEIMLPRVMYLISILFDGLQFNYDSANRLQITTFSDGAEESFATQIDQKLYYHSETIVDDEVGLIVRDYTIVRKALIDTQYVLKSRTGNFLVSCSKVLEELCSLWGRKVLDPKAEDLVYADMERNMEYLSKGLIPYGFSFDVNLLPQSFLNVAPKKIKWTFGHFDKGVLSTKLYAILFSSLHNNSQVLSDVAREAPMFLSFIAEVSDRRGHGAKTILDSRETEEIADRLLELTKSMLTIFQKHSITSST